jgi:hypothetical protein
MEVEAGGLRFILHEEELELIDAEGTTLVRLSQDETLRVRGLLNGDLQGLPNRRTVFRVPVFENSGLTCMLRLQHQEFAVRPRNISLTGISIPITESLTGLLAEEQEVSVTLRFENCCQVLQGIVRRLTPQAAGIFFPESIRGENMVPPADLMRIVMLLQRQWMNRRAPGPVRNQTKTP